MACVSTITLLAYSSSWNVSLLCSNALFPPPKCCRSVSHCTWVGFRDCVLTSIFLRTQYHHLIIESCLSPSPLPLQLVPLGRTLPTGAVLHFSMRNAAGSIHPKLFLPQNVWNAAHMKHAIHSYHSPKLLFHSEAHVYTNIRIKQFPVHTVGLS